MRDTVNKHERGNLSGIREEGKEGGKGWKGRKRE